MFKFFRKNNEIKEEEKEEVVDIHEKELTEDELREVNNFGSVDYKKKLPPKTDSNELSEKELDDMAYKYYHDDEEAYKRK